MQRTAQADANYPIFRQSIADQITQTTFRSLNRPKKGKAKAGKARSIPDPTSLDSVANLGDELKDFVDVKPTVLVGTQNTEHFFLQYCATEIFASLPQEARCITYAGFKNDPALEEKYSCPLSSSTLGPLLAQIPTAINDSLEAYSLIPSKEDLPRFFAPVFEEYFQEVSKPPPPNDPSFKATECEICRRDWVPLTYHHLIPRQVHAKALKRRWHEEWRLNSVAWLCRACHNFVHGIASNEELARELWSIERLTARQDVQNFALWLSRVRWKSR